VPNEQKTEEAPVDENSFPRPPAKIPPYPNKQEEWIPPSAEGDPTIAEMFERLEADAPHEIAAIKSLKDLMILFGEF
jgi:hypothetical protein